MDTPATNAPTAKLLPAAIRTALNDAIDKGKIDLPLLPEVAGQVLAACSNEKTEVKHLAALIQRDPSMAANLLRVANSALYASPVPIVSLPQALARLGITRVREAALIISCKTRVFSDTGDLVRDLFKHAIAAGAYAQEFARMRRWNVEEAFLCGLLHDVGKPVLLQAIADLEPVLGVKLDAETRAFAIDEGHATVGAALVKQWKLPARLAETILYHHDPFKAPTCGQTAMMTQLADELAHFALEDVNTTEESIRKHPVLETLNLYPEELDTLLARKAQVAAIAQSLT